MNNIKVTITLSQKKSGTYTVSDVQIGDVVSGQHRDTVGTTPKPNASLSILDNSETIAGLKEKFPSKNVESEIEKAKDYFLSHGKKPKDYLAFMRNWLRKDYNDSPKKGNLDL